ncbi:VRR-NUC domain-containing protein [Arcanobacterium buesumense]|uniref:VRR-NUC domain-containing protein n=1 Tax=Arcanobacterium buesumense TaxID=2722751 RepID=A0A6H2ELS6_9ACTO|nr:VRR-NUC domain-containing protein [Arcanobacterium buesumense]QJC22021.1 VRR-NUC domain-containing protein [Arcanobacterium buesumense]
MNEKHIEKHFKRLIEKHGGLCLKFVSPGTQGVPDRIIITPTGHITFAELKAPGKKPRPAQANMIRKLEKLGATVHIIDSITKAEETAHEILTT